MPYSKRTVMKTKVCINCPLCDRSFTLSTPKITTKMMNLHLKKNHNYTLDMEQVNEVNKYETVGRNDKSLVKIGKYNNNNTSSSSYETNIICK